MSALTPLFTISGASGSQNESAIQSDLAGNGVIWFQWACPTNGNYFFKTRDGGASPTNFYSSIAVYQSSVSSPTDTTQLTRFSPPGGSSPSLIYDQSGGIGNGFETGAYCAFAAAAGTTYVIRISARNAIPATANLFLAWGAYVPLVLGPCGSGPTVFFGGGKCVGQIVVPPNPIGNWYQYIAFGTYALAPGFFSVGGRDSLNLIDTLDFSYVQFGGDPGWSNPVPPDGCTSGEIPYGSYIGPSSLYVPNGPQVPFGCTFTNFNNIGGEIGWIVPGIYLCDPWVAPVDGEPFGSISTGACSLPAAAAGYNGEGQIVNNNADNCNPIVDILTILLLYTDCKIGYFPLEALTGVTASGANWQMSPTFKNTDLSYGWDNVTIGLEINGASTGVTETVTFTAGGTQTPTFVFSTDPTSGLLTATFTFSRNGVQFGTIANIPLYPVGTLTAYGFGLGFVTGNTLNYTSTDNITGCASTQGGPVAPDFTQSNGGPWFNGSLQYQVEVTGSGQLYDGVTCTPRSGQVLYAGGDIFYISKPAVNTGTILTITPQWVISGTVVANFPSQSWNVTFS